MPGICSKSQLLAGPNRLAGLGRIHTVVLVHDNRRSGAGQFRDHLRCGRSRTHDGNISGQVGGMIPSSGVKRPALERSCSRYRRDRRAVQLADSPHDGLGVDELVTGDGHCPCPVGIVEDGGLDRRVVSQMVAQAMSVSYATHIVQDRCLVRVSHLRIPVRVKMRMSIGVTAHHRHSLDNRKNIRASLRDTGYQ